MRGHKRQVDGRAQEGQTVRRDTGDTQTVGWAGEMEEGDAWTWQRAQGHHGHTDKTDRQMWGTDGRTGIDTWPRGHADTWHRQRGEQGQHAARAPHMGALLEAAP